MTTGRSTTLKQRRSNLFLSAACIVVLGLVFLLTISKDLRKRQTLETHLADQTQQLDTRELLAPLLAKLQGGGETSGPAAENGDETFQPPADVSVEDYEAVIGEMVRQYGLEQMALTPDIQSILSDTGTLRANLEVRGTFPDFRRLILALARLPFLSGIESFSIERPADTDTLGMFLQLRLQLSESAEGTHEHQ